MLINWNEIEKSKNVLSEINEIFRQDFFGNVNDWDSDDEETQQDTIECFFYDRIVYHQAKKNKSFKDINFHNKENVLIEAKLVDLFRNTFNLDVTDEELKQNLLILYRQVKDVCRLNEYHSFWKDLCKKDNEQLIEYYISLAKSDSSMYENLGVTSQWSNMTDCDWEEFFEWFWNYEDRGVKFEPSDWVKWKTVKGQNAYNC